MSSKQKLNRLLNEVQPIEKMATDPHHGHSTYSAYVEGPDPYGEGVELANGTNCHGCGRLISELESAGYLPPCPHPAQSIQVVIEYRDDPNMKPFEVREESDDLPVEIVAVVPSKSPPEPIDAPDRDEVPEIPDDATLNSMTGEQLDQIISRVLKWKEVHGKG